MDTDQLGTVPEHQQWFEDAYRSGDYVRHWDLLHPSAELVTVVAAGLIPDGASCVDVGCGAGTEAVFLAWQGYRSIGVDLSGEALRIAETRATSAGVSVDWRLASALDLPIRDSSVEFVNDRGCFHHIPEKQRPRYAAEVARVLKPGGKVLLRGCRDDSGPAPFVLVTPATLQAHFGEQFHVGRVTPIELFSEASRLSANLVVLERR